MNAGMVLSMGGFFTLMAIGLASRLPDSMYNGLTRLGRHPGRGAHHRAHPAGRHAVRRVPGRQPDQGAGAAGRPGAAAARLRRGRGHADRPDVLPAPDLRPVPCTAWLIAFGASIVMLLIAAGASLMRGERYVHADAMEHRRVAGRDRRRSTGRGGRRICRCRPCCEDEPASGRWRGYSRRSGRARSAPGPAPCAPTGRRALP